MLGGCFCHNPFVQDKLSDNDEGASPLRSLPDDLASGLGLRGLTITLAANDTSWLGIGGLPTCPPSLPPIGFVLLLLVPSPVLSLLHR
jgi:hypothetical protein